MSAVNFENIQYKASNGQVNLDEAQGIVECFVAGIGNKDSVGDICVSGAFAKSLQRRKPRVVWGHNWNDPIGKVLEIYEVPAKDPRLPMKMKMAGIGGLYARVQFNLQSEKGREAFSNVAFFGEEQEWSIGYKTLRSQYDQNLQANVLYEVELYEVSPVLHGANQLTGTISVKSDEEKMHGVAPMIVHTPADKPRNENLFEEGPEKPISGARLASLIAEISRRSNGPVEVLEATEDSVTFRKPGKGKFRISYHFSGTEYMFGKPEILAVEKPAAMESGPAPVPGVVAKPSQMAKPTRNNPAAPMPVAMKPGPDGMVVVPLPVVEYEGGSKEKTPVVVPEEQDLADALVAIAEKYGKFNEDGTGVWAGYTPAAENENADIGVKCGNCVLYRGNGVCAIIDRKVEESGSCRFAVIPDNVVKVGDKKKQYEDVVDDDEMNMIADLQQKYPGEFILGIIRGVAKRKKKRKRSRLYKSLDHFGIEEAELEAKGLDPYLAQESMYLIPVDKDQAFSVKSLIDPVLDYHRIDSFVNEDGIVITSGLTEESKEALQMATKAAAKRIGRALRGGNFLGRTLGGGRGRGRMGMPSGDLDPRTRRDTDLDGTLFDNIPGWEQPDPTPDGPGSINNPTPSSRQVANAKKKPRTERTRAPKRDDSLSSGVRRHSGMSEADEKNFPDKQEEAKREAHEQIANAWRQQGLGWMNVPRYPTDKNRSSDFLRGREIGVNQARVMWDGDDTRKRPSGFNERAKSSTKYADWFRTYSSAVASYLEAHRKGDDENWLGIENALRGSVSEKYPDTSTWNRDNKDSLGAFMQSLGFEEAEPSSRERLSSGRTRAELEDTGAADVAESTQRDRGPSSDRRLDWDANGEDLRKIVDQEARKLDRGQPNGRHSDAWESFAIKFDEDEEALSEWEDSAYERVLDSGLTGSRDDLRKEVIREMLIAAKDADDEASEQRVSSGRRSTESRDAATRSMLEESRGPSEGLEKLSSGAQALPKKGKIANVGDGKEINYEITDDGKIKISGNGTWIAFASDASAKEGWAKTRRTNGNINWDAVNKVWTSEPTSSEEERRKILAAIAEHVGDDGSVFTAGEVAKTVSTGASTGPKPRRTGKLQLRKKRALNEVESYTYTGRQPTEEQAKAIDAIMTGEDVRVGALAATGKTTTMINLMKRLRDQDPDARVIYSVFNKDAEQDFQKRAQKEGIGEVVTAKTMDAITYKALSNSNPQILSKKYGSVKGQPEIDKKYIKSRKDRAKYLGAKDMVIPNEDGVPKDVSATDVVKILEKALNQFSISDDGEIGEHHFVGPLMGKAEVTDPEALSVLLPLARKYWDDVNAPRNVDKNEGMLPVDSNHLTKIWALGEPDLMKELDSNVIVVDEAQDMNAVFAGILKRSNIQKVLVGDVNQAINAWRGADGKPFEEIDVAYSMPLTDSFRFGENIAKMGNRFLSLLNSPTRMTGRKTDGNGNPVPGQIAQTVDDPTMILTRGNGGALQAMMEMFDSGKRVRGSKRFKNDLRSFINHFQYLMDGYWVDERGNRKNGAPDLSLDLDGITTKDELLKELKKEDNRRLSMLNGLVDKHGIDGLRDALERVITSDDEKRDPSLRNAEDIVRVQTAHTAKGLESPRVQIWTDFPRPKRDQNGDLVLPNEQELRLAYVAVTRAEEELGIGGLSWIEEATTESDGLASESLSSGKKIVKYDIGSSDTDLEILERSQDGQSVEDLAKRYVTTELEIKKAIARGRLYRAAGIKRTRGESMSSGLRQDIEIFDAINRGESLDDISFVLNMDKTEVAKSSARGRFLNAIGRRGEAGQLGEIETDMQVFRRLENGEDLARIAAEYNVDEKDIKLANARGRFLSAVVPYTEAGISYRGADQTQRYGEFVRDYGRYLDRIQAKRDSDSDIFDRISNGESVEDISSSLGVPRDEVRSAEKRHQKILNDLDIEAEEWDSRWNGFYDPFDGLNNEESLSSGREKAEEMFKMVQENLIKQIESADPKNWQLPWHRGLSLPKNGNTRNNYKGTNLFMLMFRQEQMGYKTPLWASYKQWEEKGAQVRKGEKATYILRPVFKNKVDENGNVVRGENGRPVQQLSTWTAVPVFNIDQTDGLDADEIMAEFRGGEGLTEGQRVQNLEDALSEIGAVVNVGGDSAYYSPSTDQITVPPFESFKSKEQYYGTVAHEVMHWTGHSSRLDRPNLNKFGTPEYAKEELVAEIAAAYFLAAVGLTPEPREDHAQYLKGWLKALKDDPDALKNAFVEAEKAANFAIDRSPILKKLAGNDPDAIPAVADPDVAEKLSSGIKNQGKTIAEEFDLPENESASRFIREDLGSGRRSYSSPARLSSAKGSKNDGSWHLTDTEDGGFVVQHVSADGDFGNIVSPRTSNAKDALDWVEKYESSRQNWAEAFRSEQDVEKLAQMIEDENRRRDSEMAEALSSGANSFSFDEAVHMIDPRKSGWSKADWDIERNRLKTESGLASGRRSSRFDEIDPDKLTNAAQAIQRTDEIGVNTRFIADRINPAPSDPKDPAGLRLGESIAFSYKGKRRVLFPSAILAKQGGGIRVVGLDEETNGWKAYRIDQIEGLIEGAPFPENPKTPGVPSRESLSSGASGRLGEVEDAISSIVRISPNRRNVGREDISAGDVENQLDALIEQLGRLSESVAEDRDLEIGRSTTIYDLYGDDEDLLDAFDEITSAIDDHIEWIEARHSEADNLRETEREYNREGYNLSLSRNQVNAIDPDDDPDELIDMFNDFVDSQEFSNSAVNDEIRSLIDAGKLGDAKYKIIDEIDSLLRSNDEEFREIESAIDQFSTPSKYGEIVSRPTVFDAVNSYKSRRDAVEEALSSGRRRSKRGTSPRMSWNEQSRQDFADRNILKSKKRPGKRKPGPSEGEFSSGRRAIKLSDIATMPNRGRRRAVGNSLRRSENQIQVRSLSENQSRKQDGPWILPADKFINSFTDRSGKKLSDEEISEATGLSVDQIEEMKNPGAGISEADAAMFYDAFYFGGKNPFSTSDAIEAVWGYDSNPYWYDENDNKIDREQYEMLSESGGYKYGLLSPNGPEGLFGKDSGDDVPSEKAALRDRGEFPLAALMRVFGTGDSDEEIKKALTLEIDGQIFEPSQRQIERWKDLGMPTAVIEHLIENQKIKNAESVFGESGRDFDSQVKQGDVWVNIVRALDATGKKYSNDQVDQIVGATRVKRQAALYEQGKAGKFSWSKGTAPRYSRSEIDAMAFRASEILGVDLSVEEIMKKP